MAILLESSFTQSLLSLFKGNSGGYNMYVVIIDVNIQHYSLVDCMRYNYSRLCMLYVYVPIIMYVLPTIVLV